ncbi:MAG: hypothetical protein KatS3mg042_0473 [Rhodothermaceae bacterium]|nr:MAG: hypothetical protein KatS3mg042_0473 [Rhodothermaceae bacterium]
MRRPLALLWAALTVLLLATGYLWLAGRTTTPPEREQAYWAWIRTLAEAPETALDEGFALLRRTPGLPPLYLRLAETCRETDRRADCAAAFDAVTPPDTVSALYREAARTLLLPDTAAAPHWLHLASSTHLDPALARRIVDEALRHGGAPWLEALRTTWEAARATHPSAPGPAFGLGYLAVRQGRWEAAEPLLRRVTTLLPDDPEAYRELGRLYFHTGRFDELRRVLERGIEAAQARHDLRSELILRGNLGLLLLERVGDLPTAERMFEAALRQSRTLADRTSEGFNLYRLASVRFRQQRFEEARSLLQRADSLFVRYAPYQRPEVQALLGYTLQELFRFDEAERVLADAVAEAEARRNVGAWFQALNALAYLRHRMGRFSAARRTAEDLLRLARQYDALPFEVSAHLVLGDIDNALGAFESARPHYETALALARRLDDAPRIRELYFRLGQTALFLHDTDRARAYFDTLLVRVRQRADTTALALSYLGLGRVYRQFGNVRLAAGYLEEALPLVTDPARASLRARLLLERGRVALEQRDLRRADTTFRAVAALVDRAGLPPAYRYDLHMGLGTTALLTGQPERALHHFEAALTSEPVRYQPVYYGPALYGRARAYWRLGRFAEAEADFRRAVDLVESVRDRLHTRALRASYIQDKVQLYKDFATFLEEQGRPAEAYHFIERSRARSLADLLFTLQRDDLAPEEAGLRQILEAEQRRRAITEALEGGAALEPASVLPAPLSPDRARAVERAYAEADSLYRAGLARLSSDRPLGALLTRPPLTLDAARDLLHPDEALLAFDLRPAPTDTLAPRFVVYVLTRDSLAVVPLPATPEQITEAIRFFRDQITTAPEAGPAFWQNTGRRLHALLMAPLLRHLPARVRHLHLMPEGPLYYLPFAALVDSSGTFLAERYSLSATPSASVLQIVRHHNPHRYRSLLVVADPARRLPGTRQEAAALRALPGLDVRTLIGEQARREEVVRLAGQYDLLHFATHGAFVRRRPWASYLELHDAPLRADDIGRLRLRASLVILSACETALAGGAQADIPAGDEWVGLNQAFLAAGTPTVMASLWPIDDRISSDFMRRFYERFLTTGDKARALAEVQRAFIADPATRHPFFWAPFVLTGDPH